MIVEDQFLIAKQLEWILRGAGHTVVGVASTLAEASALAESSKPDLAMVDISLADGVSGMKVAETLTRTTGTNVVFVTANGRRLDGDFHGAIGFVEKPFTKVGVTTAVTYLKAILRDNASRMPNPPSLVLAPELR